MAAAERPLWDVPAPPGGWGPPWPQCVELAHALPHKQWTFVGGLMVQLHAVAAVRAVTRPTADVDMVLHVETGAATIPGLVGGQTYCGSNKTGRIMPIPSITNRTASVGTLFRQDITDSASRAA
ncbi:hypothetical protein [Arthrobacter sp. VKM Ac-2550]|uniref:hypothetical protein n=1 Tax=Crystallibacter permensis TaxID=1938888 RepID=UPI002227FE29|nr:hypothetical protein [Arthrobacter sp. VKM Ac-2550]MCW2135156.1 hypothetical protein [Arthrobacter sp. VKM Ac-2550]